MIIVNVILIALFLAICYTQLGSHKLFLICPNNWMFTSHRLERHMKCWSDCMVFTSKNEKKSTVSNQDNPLLSIWYKVGFATAVPSIGKFNRDKKGKVEAK